MTMGGGTRVPPPLTVRLTVQVASGEWRYRLSAEVGLASRPSAQSRQLAHFRWPCANLTRPREPQPEL